MNKPPIVTFDGWRFCKVREHLVDIADAVESSEKQCDAP